MIRCRGKGCEASSRVRMICFQKKLEFLLVRYQLPLIGAQIRDAMSPLRLQHTSQLMPFLRRLENSAVLMLMARQPYSKLRLVEINGSVRLLRSLVQLMVWFGNVPSARGRLRMSLAWCAPTALLHVVPMSVLLSRAGSVCNFLLTTD